MSGLDSIGLGDPRLMAHALSATPAWAWSADGSRVLWANPPGAEIFKASTPDALAAMRFAANDPTGMQIARLADSLPEAGVWYLWARLYYPGAPDSNDANSFFARVDSGTRLRLGNNKDYFRRWHWGGDGSLERGIPTALKLGRLAAGTHRLTIEKREVVPAAPRLDLLVLTQDPTWVPTDE